MGIIDTTTYSADLGVYILKWDVKQITPGPSSIYDLVLYTTYQISALATAEPTTLLALAESATLNTASLVLPNGPTISRWIVEEATSEQIDGTLETIYNVNITIKGLGQDYAINTELTETTPFLADISYSRGSPTSGTITALGTLFTAGGNVTLTACNFTGFVMRSETYYDDQGRLWGKAYVTDYGSEYINRIIAGPYFFPGSSNYTKCYRDGSDHTVAIDTVFNFIFGLVGLTATGLPTQFGFHSGLNGESTWTISMQPIGQIAQVAYELTGLRPIWYGSNCYFGINRVTTIWPLRYSGSGQDYSSYRASVVGMGAKGMTHTDGSGYPQGFIVMPGITDATELENVVAAVKTNCRTANTKVWRGTGWQWNIGDDCLSAHMTIANKMQSFSGSNSNLLRYATVKSTEVVTTDL